MRPVWERADASTVIALRGVSALGSLQTLAMPVILLRRCATRATPPEVLSGHDTTRRTACQRRPAVKMRKSRYLGPLGL